jgi:hypothetical protein
MPRKTKEQLRRSRAAKKGWKTRKSNERQSEFGMIFPWKLKELKKKHLDNTRELDFLTWDNEIQYTDFIRVAELIADEIKYFTMFSSKEKFDKLSDKVDEFKKKWDLFLEKASPLHEMFSPEHIEGIRESQNREEIINLLNKKNSKENKIIQLGHEWDKLFNNMKNAKNKFLKEQIEKNLESKEDQMRSLGADIQIIKQRLDNIYSGTLPGYAKDYKIQTASYDPNYKGSIIPGSRARPISGRHRNLYYYLKQLERNRRNSD